MKKQRYLFYAVLCAGITMSTATPATTDEKAPPLADSSKMMLEHIGMDCQTCHFVVEK